MSYDPTDDRFLLIDLDEDTLPQNTLDPVDAIINPLTFDPGTPAAGTRYLILDDMGDETAAWGQFINARANDIIEFDGSYWTVAFEAAAQTTQIEYVTNITTGIQYRWTTTEWVKSYEGLYPTGEWSLVL